MDDNDIQRLLNKFDEFQKEFNVLSTRFERLIAQLDVLGFPGASPQCQLHLERLDSLEADFEDSVSRLTALERAKERAAGFFAGMAAVGGMVGALIAFGVQVALKKMGI